MKQGMLNTFLLISLVSLSALAHAQSLGSTSTPQPVSSGASASTRTTIPRSAFTGVTGSPSRSRPALPVWHRSCTPIPAGRKAGSGSVRAAAPRPAALTS